ncbi:hypothetical protein PPERSA_09113 [Pseudocohnilembus persalinus]|uniref:Roadblock/LAMTOR2 domain-containing protein n=1 Tax=Pseudocohnilembus persalinus TaxID=266149 RepID=A0A0V0QWT2_PSEPJ|nr:hypothetical protein PPERSA_09113 [Pseudocohnilembus persalinus]|eukprot:KRX06711.1 hypothetical protein PPERSA_09113 [Pseudocohnilembus persalinus]
MIRPNKLQQYLDQIVEDFQEFENIFITINEGSVVASSNQKDKYFYSALTSLWEDCSVIARLNLYNEDKQKQQPLNQCIVEHEKGNVILCALNDMFVIGFCLSKDKSQLAFALQKANIVKKAVEQQFQETYLVQNKEETNLNEENQDD